MADASQENIDDLACTCFPSPSQASHRVTRLARGHQVLRNIVERVAVQMIDNEIVFVGGSAFAVDPPFKLGRAPMTRLGSRPEQVIERDTTSSHTTVRSRQRVFSNRQVLSSSGLVSSPSRFGGTRAGTELADASAEGRWGDVPFERVPAVVAGACL